MLGDCRRHPRRRRRSWRQQTFAAGLPSMRPRFKQGIYAHKQHNSSASAAPEGSAVSSRRQDLAPMGLGAAAGTRRRLDSVTLESKPPGLGAAWPCPCMDSGGNETRLSGTRRRPFSALPPCLSAAWTRCRTGSARLHGRWCMATRHIAVQDSTTSPRPESGRRVGSGEAAAVDAYQPPLRRWPAVLPSA